MNQPANYIRRIEIDGLWERIDIAWDLRPDVNILSGINGIGKTTILNCAVGCLDALSGNRAASGGFENVHLTFDREDAGLVRYDLVRSFAYAREQDKRLAELSSRYAGLPPGGAKELLVRQLDTLFGYTGKQLETGSTELCFRQAGERLPLTKLSSGEKQMLIILLTVLLRAGVPCVLFMDEPEASLHIEWQQKLIGLIRALNPQVQLILSTHSPAVIMEGWLDAVTEVSDISSPHHALAAQ
ncbi:MAG: AAA family ATPase [Prevotellaceae bacterium]|jgi:predicted ATPase|nr:AAA family ATPase [Prevotellaceae bacterium]